MARSRQEAALRAQEAAAAELKPGMTILARAKGYPAWPALVVDEADVPESVKGARPGKKVVVPVLFYNDNTFLWISPTEAEYLSTESAVKASKSKVKKQLKEAYAIASNPPPYEEILGSLNDGEEKEDVKDEQDVDTDAMEVEQLADSDQQMASEDVKPEPSGRSKPRRARSAAERALEVPVPRSKRAKTSASTASNGRPSRGGTSTSGAAGDDDDDSEYVDTGSTETGNETGTETVLTETENEYSEKTLANSQTARFDLCSEARQVLQETLLRDQPASESEYAKCSDLVQRVINASVEISVLRRSKLSRVVSAALQTEVPTPLKTELEELAALWNTAPEPIIRGIPEHLAPAEEPTRENTEEPQSEPQSEAPSEAPSEAQSEAPSEPQSKAPSEVPSEAPSEPQSKAPSEVPSEAPSEPQSKAPSEVPSEAPSEAPLETQPAIQSKLQSELQTEPKSESEAEPKSATEAEPKSESQSEPATEPTAEVSSEAPVEASSGVSNEQQ